MSNSGFYPEEQICFFEAHFGLDMVHSIKVNKSSGTYMFFLQCQVLGSFANFTTYFINIGGTVI